MTLPTTPSKFKTHSRQVSSDGGTEFGTPDSSFPTDTDSPAAGTAAESTRPLMVGLGLSTPVSGGSRSNSPSAEFIQEEDVFGGGQSLDSKKGGSGTVRDAALDEVDQFLNEAARDSDEAGTRGSSLDYSKTRIELNGPGQRRQDSTNSSSAQSPGSHTEDPLLEVLDDEEEEDEEEEEMELFEDGDGDEEDFDTQEPLVGRRGRKRRRWVGGAERKKDESLLEVSHRDPGMPMWQRTREMMG